MIYKCITISLLRKWAAAEASHYCELGQKSGQILNPFSAGTVLIRQNLTSDLSVPRTERMKIRIITVDSYHLYIQMKRKELTKTFMIYNNIVYDLQ